MSLFRLKKAPFILIEDYAHSNVLPLLLELVLSDKNTINLICYEQPVLLWKNIFKNCDKINYYDEFSANMLNKLTNEKSSIVIDSVIQMALCMGWNKCLKYIKILENNINVTRLILILHKDCISHGSKLQVHLNYLVSTIISYSKTNPQNIQVLIKKGNKVIRSEEVLVYDTNMCLLKLTPIIKHEKKEEDQVKPMPANLSTFKIEVDQTEKIQKYNLKLPYMSKIHDGQSKVYYEPDSVDDWDEEDPDEDLDI